MKTSPSPLEIIARDLVAEIQDIKQASGKIPDLATLDEIINSLRPELLESLRALYRSGTIECHKTVNGTPMFGIKHHAYEDTTE